MREFLRQQADQGLQVDSVVTDPPYGLVSTVKRFGKEGSAPAKSNGATGVYKRASAGFMGQTWDGEGVERDPETWRAVYDVMKPGAHLLAFGGTRTWHRIAAAIEDAGFELRDTIMWLYGTGFPKSHNDPAGMEGWGTALKPSWEPVIVARKPLIGTVAQNVLAHGTGAINIDGCRAPLAAGEEPYHYPNGPGGSDPNHMWRGREKGDGAEAKSGSAAGRWPANLAHDGSDEVEAAFAAFGERTSGVPGTRRKAHETTSMAGTLGMLGRQEVGYADSGSASRFFYCAKATQAERNGTTHPTVKPVALMRWLVRMVTPPGGTVLDPFAGSGTTGLAAQAEGFNFLLVERDEKYHAQASARLGIAAPTSGFESAMSRLEAAVFAATEMRNA